MTAPSPLLIRADAGGDLGTGHVMRMIALAQAWQDRGGKVVMASCRCPDPLALRLRAEHIVAEPIAAEPDSSEDLKQTTRLAHNLGATWVVLDGYHFREAFQQALRDSGSRVLAVDDCSHCRHWPADLVLNTNLHAEELRSGYERSNPDTRFLLGARYALLRREFTREAGASHRSRHHPPHLLVTFGGVDPGGATIQIIDALETIGSPPWLCRVIVGGANPRIEEIRNRVARSARPMELRADVEDMTYEYLWADAVISAGGSSCHEWLRYNLPAWVVSIAPNQDPILDAIKRQALACTAGRIEDHRDPVRLGESLSSWLANPRPPARHPVDGWGATRITCELEHDPCWIRPVQTASADDARFLFSLANDPTVRAAGYHPAAIPWENHLAWVNRHANHPGSRLWFIVHRNGESAGFIRFHLQPGGAWEIGISIHESFRGGGIAKSALKLAMARHTRESGEVDWIATIRPSNASSQNLFQALGFRVSLATGERSEWRLHSSRIP